LSPIQELERHHGPSPEDSRLLAQLHQLAIDSIDSIGLQFHDAIKAASGEAEPGEETDQERAYRARLQRWPREMLRGPHDQAYREQRQETARRYALLGLPHWRIFTAVAGVTNALTGVVFRSLEADRLSATEAARMLQALNSAMTLELAIFNITYHRTREARKLRTLQEVIVTHMPVTVLCLDAKGRVTAATRPSARIFGDRAQVGQPYDAFLPPSLVEVADLPTYIGRALATGEEVSISRVTLGRVPNTRHLRINIVPLEHPLAHLLLQVEDLTDAVQAEARVQQAEALARIGSLAANVAHEIRNPLAAISLALQVIARSFDPSDRRIGTIRKVEDQVTRLDRLVTDLLDYARPPAPKIRRIDLARVAQDSISVSSSGAELVLSEPESAMADAGLLQAALLNLLQNARDAAGEMGKVWLQVGPGAELAVMDDGPGIDPRVLDKLFTPFVTTKARGTGLGLAISRKLVESQTGTLRLDARFPRPADPQGGGACFRISLQAAAEARASEAGNAEHSG